MLSLAYKFNCLKDEVCVNSLSNIEMRHIIAFFDGNPNATDHIMKRPYSMRDVIFV